MIIPRQNTTTHKVCEVVYQSKNVTIDAVSQMLKIERAKVKAAMFKLRENGVLLEHEGMFYLPLYMRRYFDESQPQETYSITRPRTPTPFTPLSDKHKFWLAHRREPLREISFISCDTQYRQLGEPA